MDIEGYLTLLTAWDSRDFVRVRTIDRRMYCGQVKAISVRTSNTVLEGELVLVASAIGTLAIKLTSLRSVAILGASR